MVLSVISFQSNNLYRSLSVLFWPNDYRATLLARSWLHHATYLDTFCSNRLIRSIDTISEQLDFRRQHRFLWNSSESPFLFKLNNTIRETRRITGLNNFRRNLFISTFNLFTRGTLCVKNISSDVSTGAGEEEKVEKRKYMKMRSRFLGRKERKAPVEVAV